MANASNINASNSTHRPCILAVDDTPDNLRLLHELLKGQYQIKLANSGASAIEIVRNTPPDLILLDVMMPKMDGYAVCSALKWDPTTQDIPIIFLTALSSPEDEEYGISLGAVDYISKPFSPSVALARIKNHLNQKAIADFLRSKQTYLESLVAERTQQIEGVQDATIYVMATLAGTRDNETGNHIRRTQHYVRKLAERLSTHPRFEHFLTPENIQLLFKSAPLHDIGKIGIPDEILRKPGKLTPDEMVIMRTHAQIGRDTIAQAERDLGTSLDFLAIAKEVAGSHHEKWDGNGYPRGLAGDDIPPSARLMSVADVYDALICKRVYKKPMTHEQAVEIITNERGRSFDPDIVDTFLSIQDDFIQIAQRYADPDDNDGLSA